MSSLSLGKKLLPARKAWKSFVSTIRRKLHKLKRSKAIKKSTNRLNTSVSVVLGASRSIKPLTLRRKRDFTRPQYLRKSFAPVYVDELFKGGSVSMHVKQLEPPEASSTSKERGNCVGSGSIRGDSEGLGGAAMAVQKKRAALVEVKLLDGSSSEMATTRTNDGIDSWEVPESALEEERGVDERAEEFIAKFQEEMKLQRQRSFGDYQEMLARSV